MVDKNVNPTCYCYIDVFVFVQKAIPDFGRSIVDELIGYVILLCDISDMDKSWIDLVNRISNEYMTGLDNFLDFAFSKRPLGSKEIYCPCRGCSNRYQKDRMTVKSHCVEVGFEKDYKNWTRHGEDYIYAHDNDNNGSTNGEGIEIDLGVRDCMRQMIHEGMGMPNSNHPGIEEIIQSDAAVAKFHKLLGDADQPLWEGCNEFTILSFIVELMHWKANYRLADKGFTSLLKILIRALPKSAKVPNSYREAYKMTADLGFSYKTWDACVNHCMLFRNEAEKLTKCEICEASRYKQKDEGGSDEGGETSGKTTAGKQVAMKKVWYFPLKPRLQRLYWSSKTAALMRWHAEERIDDGVLRHPADSQAWKSFDERYPHFSSEVRNVRLGLASDGFNPFRTMTISHSTWPIVLIPYNLPPWLCMKQPHFFLSILIQGPKGPGNKIDVYLQLVIEELKELWEDGVRTYDASRYEMFTLRASLLWTINDFPAYAMLSGWSTKGEYACPCCNVQPQARWLAHGGKFSYIGHRRFLPRGHAFRTNKSCFDGAHELREKPKLQSGSDLLKQVEDMETEYKVEDVLRKRKREEAEKKQAKSEKRKPHKLCHNWKKKSIFFELPYWEYNLVRHNLDVMHIEKNVCDNLLYTLLGTTGKSKDNVNARKDLREMNIRKPLHPQPLTSGRDLLPPAQFTMSKKDKDTFLNVLKGVKVPDGYSSNISRCVHPENRTIWGLKSHDSHILLQQLLPLAARKSLPADVVKAIIELANFFRQLSSKVSTLADLEKIQDRMVVTLCSLEKIFPPAFFDVMEHLPVHLADEALLAGPIQFRWMYPIERFLLTLKLYVRNRAHPEASIAKAIVAEECMTFCTQYLADVETKSNRPRRNDDEGHELGRFVGKEEDITLDYTTRVQAHRYVLFNTEDVEQYLEMHRAHLRNTLPRNQRHLMEKEHNEKFDSWFKDYVCKTKDGVPERIKNLALGPHMDARRFNSYIINGFRYRVKDIDRRRKTQNSGVMLKACVTSFASRKDKNPILGDVNFYGELIDILEIRYSNSMRFVLFKCDWVDNRTGKMEDEQKFTLVNFSHKLYKDNRETDEPFILASQAEQVWYVKDPIQTDWKVVMRMTSRDSFDIYSTDDARSSESVPQVVPFCQQDLDESVTNEVPWVREGVDGIVVESNSTNNDVDMANSDDD